MLIYKNDIFHEPVRAGRVKRGEASKGWGGVTVARADVLEGTAGSRYIVDTLNTGKGSAKPWKRLLA